MHAQAVESLSGKKLGILITHPPGHPCFHHALQFAEAALAAGVTVYAYCLDDAVEGLDDERIPALQRSGLALYACAYGARRRHLRPGTHVLLAGLSVLNDLLTATDRFICF